MSAVAAAVVEPNGMDFSDALRLVRAGRQVARKGWNGRGMWLVYISGEIDGYGVLTLFADNGHGGRASIQLQPFVAMKTADDKLVPWLCSQTDMLALDWIEVTP